MDTIRSILRELRDKRAGTTELAAKAAGSSFLQGIPADYLSDSGLTRTDIAGKLQRFADCADWIEFKEYGDGQHRLDNAHYCKQPAICEICADRVQSRRRDRLAPAISAAAALADSDGRHVLRPYFLTFTVAPGDDVERQIDKLQSTFRAFRKKGQRRGDHYSGGEWGKVAGAVARIEIKKGQGSGLPHVHLHALAFCSERLDIEILAASRRNALNREHGAGQIPREEYARNAARYRELLSWDFAGNAVTTTIPVSKLSEEWLDASGGVSCNVDVRPVHHEGPRGISAKKRRRLQAMSYERSICEQTREIFKYTSMLDFMDPDFTCRVLVGTHGRRLFSTYGIFFNPKDGRPEDPRDFEGSDLSDSGAPAVAIYRIAWNKSRGSYSDPVPVEIAQARALADSLRSETLSAQGKLLGQYRRDRAEFCGLRGVLSPAAVVEMLDSRKDFFRGQVSRLWEHFKQSRAWCILGVDPPWGIPE